MALCKKVVVKGCSNTTNMKRPGWAWSKSHTYFPILHLSSKKCRAKIIDYLPKKNDPNPALGEKNKENTKDEILTVT